ILQPDEPSEFLHPQCRSISEQRHSRSSSRQDYTDARHRPPDSVCAEVHLLERGRNEYLVVEADIDRGSRVGWERNTRTCSTSTTGPDTAAAHARPCFDLDRKSTRLNSSHVSISYAVFCLKKKTQKNR